MKKLHIIKRSLTEKEIDKLQEEVKPSPNITLFPKKRWKQFHEVYIASNNKDFIGACAVVHLGTWKKIGPLIIKKQFHNKKYGKQLLMYVMNKHKNNHLFVGSSNHKVWRILEKQGFRKTQYFDLPKEIKSYFFFYIIKNMSYIFIRDWLRKTINNPKRNYQHYVKLN